MLDAPLEGPLEVDSRSGVRDIIHFSNFSSCTAVSRVYRLNGMNDKHRTDIYKSHLHMVTEEITSLL
jgi:hypothetical protein